MESVFVYGSLRPGGWNYPLLEGTTMAEEPASADGLALYGDSGGSFPYARAQPGWAICGTLCTISDWKWPAVRHRLDLLEGFDPSHPDTSHYLRRRWSVRATPTDSTGTRNIIAWLYLAAPRVRINPAHLISSGDWLNR